MNSAKKVDGGFAVWVQDMGVNGWMLITMDFNKPSVACKNFTHENIIEKLFLYLAESNAFSLP